NSVELVTLVNCSDQCQMDKSPVNISPASASMAKSLRFAGWRNAGSVRRSHPVQSQSSGSAKISRKNAVAVGPVSLNFTRIGANPMPVAPPIRARKASRERFIEDPNSKSQSSKEAQGSKLQTSKAPQLRVAIERLSFHFLSFDSLSFELHFLPTSSSTAAVIAVTPVLIVGSGTGRYRLEWRAGSGLPVRSLSTTRSGSTEPSQKMQMGILSAVRPYSLKSSPPITGLRETTLLSP